MEGKLKLIFSETLGIDESNIKDDLRFNSIPEWDSLAHISLVAEIEEKFKITFEAEDIMEMTSFAEAKAILKKLGVNNPPMN
ncbi:acyl carrier protein [Metabacillus arenae]|uniref:Acyl carrier protein n=1 Tax=Metabacillus arenae TaxID=2771434 RepID=A0A926RYC9_9BACI|nr:acyl carrier protein [Metabacillus arenae]MBD1381931.1 acyl carrier protein [Metabacillus arenae]